jgi:hypothetical protein
VLIALNKPFGVACKFSPEPGRRTLAEYVPVRDVYPAGRLDTDSEGLLLLTDDGALQAPQTRVTKLPRCIGRKSSACRPRTLSQRCATVSISATS